MLPDLDPFTVLTFLLVRWHVHFLFSFDSFSHHRPPKRMLFLICAGVSTPKQLLATNLGNHQPLEWSKIDRCNRCVLASFRSFEWLIGWCLLTTSNPGNANTLRSFLSPDIGHRNSGLVCWGRKKLRIRSSSFPCYKRLRIHTKNSLMPTFSVNPLSLWQDVVFCEAVSNYWLSRSSR